MTDDDELRDGFGDEIADALRARAGVRARAGADAPDPVATVERRARRTRTRRRAFVGALATTLAAALVAVVPVVTRPHHVHVAGVVAPSSSAPSTNTAPTIAAPPGYRIVSYHGVHVQVPASWPVVDGMHTGFCYGPLVDTPTAFVGPQDNGSPSCPAMPGELAKPRDGVWIQPEAAPTDAHTVTLASGQTVFEEPVITHLPNVQLWYHGASVLVGFGPDRRIGERILASLGYAPAVRDTAAAGVCARSDSSRVMPTPERLRARLVLEQGNVTLDPPAATDQPVVTASDAWNQHGTPQNFEVSRIVLARYSATYPADQHADGSVTPELQHRLAWVVLTEPDSPEIAGCGMWGIDVFDATTGQALGSSGYAPGP